MTTRISLSSFPDKTERKPSLISNKRNKRNISGMKYYIVVHNYYLNKCKYVHFGDYLRGLWRPPRFNPIAWPQGMIDSKKSHFFKCWPPSLRVRGQICGHPCSQNRGRWTIFDLCHTYDKRFLTDSKASASEAGLKQPKTSALMSRGYKQSFNLLARRSSVTRKLTNWLTAFVK